MWAEDNTVGLNENNIRQAATERRKARTRLRALIAKHPMPENNAEAADRIQGLIDAARLNIAAAKGWCLRRYSFDLSAFDLADEESIKKFDGDELFTENAVRFAMMTLALNVIISEGEKAYGRTGNGIDTYRAIVQGIADAWERLHVSLHYNDQTARLWGGKSVDSDQTPLENLVGYVESIICLKPHGKLSSLGIKLVERGYANPLIGLRKYLPATVVDNISTSLVSSELPALRTAATKQIERDLNDANQHLSLDTLSHNSRSEDSTELLRFDDAGYAKVEDKAVAGQYLKEIKDLLTDEDFGLYAELLKQSSVRAIAILLNKPETTIRSRINALLKKLNPLRMKHGFSPLLSVKDFGSAP